MKMKKIVIIGIVLAAFAFVQIAAGVFSHVNFTADDNYGGDLRLRRNEILCAHQGVNSFRIWNRDVTLPGFKPYGRPDKPNVTGKAGDRAVHAYTPMHTTLFYFYGWLSESLCFSVMSCVFGFCLFFIVCESFRLSKERFGDTGGGLASCFALTIISFFAAQCFLSLNYGVLLLAVLLLMNRALEKGHDVAAGLLWAVTMIKPQVGLLFVWPLLWHRHYRAIVVAAATGLALTIVASLIVHESVVDLILQIPQIGKPYGSGATIDKIVKPILGEHASFAVMMLFFGLTGLATWLLRKSRDFVLCCVPVVLAMSLWTYGSLHDQVVKLPLFIFLGGLMFAARKFDKWCFLGTAYCVVLLPLLAWNIAVGAKLLDPTGIGWMYRLTVHASNALLIAFVALLIREERRNEIGKRG